jgi:hypothetical protein
MTPIPVVVRRMTFQEADEVGLHSRGLILEYEGKRYRLSAGTSDTIHVFTRSIYLFVLTLNRSLGYMGLDAYVPLEKEPINTIFLHSEHQIRELLGRNWNQMTPETLANRLTEYLM